MVRKELGRQYVLILALKEKNLTNLQKEVLAPRISDTANSGMQYPQRLKRTR